MSKPQVGLIMGSQTDWSTMREAADVLSELNIAYEKKNCIRSQNSKPPVLVR